MHVHQYWRSDPHSDPAHHLRLLSFAPRDAGASARKLLERAKARLDRLDFYPEPVDLSGVRIVVAPWLFRVPGFRRFRGYATRHLILLKHRSLNEDLVVHELCHVWQLQFNPLRVWLSYARPSTFARDRTGYRANRYEVEAHRAVELTRGPQSQRAMATQNTEAEQLLRERLAEVQCRLAELAKAPEPGAGIAFGKRIGDGTSEAISRRYDIGVGNSLRVTEEKLQRALAKLDEGSYGRCDNCGGAIGAGRLAVAPESALCTDCAR